MKTKIFTSLAVILVLISTAAVVVFGASPKAYNRRGVDLGDKKLYNPAIDEFDRAIRMYDRDSAQVYHNKGYAEQLRGENAKAFRNYEEALRRNPRQILTGENLGFLYYKTGDYENAVRVGEHVLKMDPQNKEIPKWLPDAYFKRLQNQRDKELLKKKKENEEEEKRDTDKQLEEEQRERAARTLYLSFDFTVRTGLYPKENNLYKYIPDPITQIPLNLFLRYTPLLAWEFDLTAENPHLASEMPDTVIFAESISALFKIKRFMLGIGILFGHYWNDIAFNKDLNLWDVKVGFIFGYAKEKFEYRFTFYPRLILYDGPFNTGKTFDMSTYKIDAIFNVNLQFSVFVLMRVHEYWVFDHTNKLSDYWGIYQFGLGVTIGRLAKSGKYDFKFTIEFIEKLYYEDHNNSRPYDALNGQGFFGFNSDKWYRGDPMSSFRTMGSSLGFRVDEKLVKNVFLYQKITFEMGNQSISHYELDFTLGMGLIF